MNIMIAVTNVSAANGGVTTHIIDLCRELTKKEHKVVLLSDKKDCDYWNKINELEKSEKFKFISVDLKNIQDDKLKLVKTIFKVKRIVKDNRIDIMHMHSQSFCVIGGAIKVMTGVPYIWTNHIDEIANPALFKKIINVLHFPVISVSTDLKKILVHNYGVSENRITVINNGINVNNFTPLSEETKKYGKTTGNVRINM